VAARARTAAELRCKLVAAEAEPGTASARNLRARGLRSLGSRVEVPVPAAELAPSAAQLTS
jgi:hypothetical protein